MAKFARKDRDRDTFYYPKADNFKFIINNYNYS